MSKRVKSRWIQTALAKHKKGTLHKALGVQALKNPARQAELASMAWKPWRSYAVIRAWNGTLDIKHS